MEPSEPAPQVHLGFEGFVGMVRKRRPTLYGQLSHVRPVKFGPGEVELGVDTRFDEATLGAPETKRYLEELLAEHLGAPTGLTVTRLEKPVEAAPALRSPAPPPTMVEREEDARRVRHKEKEEEARKKKAVKTVLDELGAKVSGVRVLEDEEPPSHTASAKEENA
jgi:hypothetical protein